MSNGTNNYSVAVADAAERTGLALTGEDMAVFAREAGVPVRDGLVDLGAFDGGAAELSLLAVDFVEGGVL